MKFRTNVFIYTKLGCIYFFSGCLYRRLCIFSWCLHAGTDHNDCVLNAIFVVQSQLEFDTS